MAGHSHWKQIKEHKGNADKKRAALFAKLLRAVAVAARHDPNPQFNPQLRAAIEKARTGNVPSENIDRAVARAENEGELEELIIEAYGPGGTALLIHSITSNRNRTVNEVKALLKEHGAKWAEPGSVRWAFQETRDAAGAPSWTARFPQQTTTENTERVRTLTQALGDLDDVDAVFTNSAEG